MPDNLDRPGTAQELLVQRHRIKFFIDRSFPEFVKSEIRGAVELAIDELTLETIERHPLYDCALSHVTEPVGGQWLLHLLGQWHDIFHGSPNGFPIRAERRGRVGGYFIVRIVKLWGEPPDASGRYTAGRAYVGHFYNGPSVIAITQEWVNGQYTFDYPTLSQIAGTVVHEMLHTFGLTHPDDDTGTFIEEYGNCFARKYNHLTDEYLLASK